MESSAPVWVTWISLLLAIATPITLLACRTWIIARITKGVQYNFDVELEEIRAALRTNEEQLKSGLREKEAEIGTLRNTVLSGSAGRQTLLDKRRFEAVEKIWTTVNDLAKLKGISQIMALLDFDGIGRHTKNPKVQEFLATIDTTGSDTQSLKDISRDERPFVPEITWAYFFAFKAVLYFNSARLKLFRSGIENPQTFITTEPVKKILKAALPHQTQFIDGQDPGLYYYLLNEIEDKLLNELRKILDGKEAGLAAAQQGKEILSAIKEEDDAQVRDNVSAALSP
jgi:hypothetical protein